MADYPEDYSDVPGNHNWAPLGADDPIFSGLPIFVLQSTADEDREEAEVVAEDG
jgi:hypothetical protein